MRVALNGLFLRYPATGTGQYLRELVSAIRGVGNGVEPVFISPRNEPGAPAPVIVHRTIAKSKNGSKLEFEQITFPRACRTGFELAHVPHFGPPLLSTCPTVVTIHDLIPIVLPEYRNSAKVKLYSQIAGRGARGAMAILADSHASARDIRTQLGIAPEKIHVVHLAANVRFQPPVGSDLERVRAKYQLPQQYVLYLGGFDARKNVNQVIKAFAQARTNVQARNKSISHDLHLVIAGKLPEQDTEFFPDPRRMAEEHGVRDQTRFVGFVDEQDKPALYGCALAFLYPSRYEGFGLPPLEAMASGTPVISSNAASLPEVVGDAGVLLAPDDESGWVNALTDLMTDEGARRHMRQLGLRRAALFSWERTAYETIQVYRSVVR
jgi:glycosyltransferase involved in cell wall biosynthesis